jgi:hypothetical protein
VKAGVKGTALALRLFPYMGGATGSGPRQYECKALSVICCTFFSGTMITSIGSGAEAF